MAPLFDLNAKRNEKPQQTAERLAERLTEAIAEAGIIPDYVGSCDEFRQRRVDKSKRAQTKAISALQTYDYQAAVAHARRGLLHLELAHRHSFSEKTDLNQNLMPAPSFAADSAGEAIENLATAICNIKLLAEYRKITLNKSLSGRLARAVEQLHEAIETYAQPGNNAGKQDRAAQNLSECALVWCQFIYGQLNGDRLLLTESKKKPLRALMQFSKEVSLEIFNDLPFLEREKGARHHVRSIEQNLALAIEAYSYDDEADMNKFMRLGLIEATALSKFKERSTLESAGDEPTNFNLDYSETSTLKENLAETSAHLSRYEPRPHRALNLLSKIDSDIASLKKLMKQQEWPQAGTFAAECRLEIENLENEIRKLDI